MDTSNIREKRMNSRLEYTKAKADFEELYANADDDTRAKIEGLMRSSLNYSSANPMNNRSAREYQTQIYKNAVDIMNGKITPATSGIVSTPNWFNGYSHEENQNNANYVTNRYLDGNGARQSRPSTSGASVPAGSGSFHRYNWAKGLESGWALDTDTLDDRMKSFASALTRNLSEAAGASKAGKKLIGIGDNEISQALALLNRTDWNKDSFKSLMEAAKIAGVDPQWFMDYFDGLVPGSDPVEKAKQALLNKGYTEYGLDGYSNYIKNLAKNKKLTFFKDKAGNIRAFNQDYTEYEGNPFTEFNDDWETEGVENGGYGDVMMMDDSGNIYMGRSADIDKSSAFNVQYQKALNDSITNRRNLHHEWNIGDTNDTSSAEALQALQREFGHNINGSDVSKLFSGNDKIWVTDPSGIAFTEDAYGNARFKNTAKFYIVGDDNSVTETTFDALRSKYNRAGWDGEQDYQLGQPADLDRYLKNDYDLFTYNDQMDLYGRTFGDALLLSYGIPVEASTLVASVLFGKGFEGMALDKASKIVATQLLRKKGKTVTKKAVEDAAQNITKKAMMTALKNGSLKTALKKAGYKAATRLGIHGALAAGGLGTFGISTALGAGLALGEAGIRYGAWDNVYEHPDEFVHNLLGAIANKGNGELKFKSKDGSVSTNAAFLKRINYADNENDMIRFLYGYLKQHPEIKLNSQELATWREMMRNYNSRYVQAQKEGGIIKASKGTYLDPVSGLEIINEPYTNPETKKAKADYQGLRKRFERANEKGYGNDLERMDASLAKMFSGNFNMTTSDVLRISTMAQDVASIVASFVPGAGTGVAAGLGVTALGTDLVADILDPAVSAGEVAKNAAINAGFAGLGLIPGAKMHKVVKNVVKYAPKIITAAAAMGIAMDESTQKTFAKLGDGTQKLNREDWRNLSHVLSLVAAGTRGVKGDIARRKVGKGIVAGENVKLKGVKNAEGNDFELPKSKVKEINDELAKVKTPEELATVREKYSLPEEAIKAPLIKEGKLSGKYKLVDTESTKNSDATYDKLRVIWNQEAQDVENSSKLGRWFANKLGGGDYTAKQRAILENLENNDYLREYAGKYNPMIDWQNLRKNAGTTRMKARYTSPEVKDNGPIIPVNKQLALPAHKPEPAPIKRRNPAIERSYDAQREAAKKVSNPAEIKVKAPKLESLTAGAQLIGPSGQHFSVVGIRNTKWGKRINLIDNITKLRVTVGPENLERYQLVQTQVGENGNLSIPFKDGGKVNYQKLRK